MESLRFWTRVGVAICAAGVVIINVSILFNWPIHFLLSSGIMAQVGILIIVIPFGISFFKNLNPFAEFSKSKILISFAGLGIGLLLIGSLFSITYAPYSDTHPLWLKICVLAIVSIGVGFVIPIFFQTKKRG